jgi:hypothetical protein
VVAVRDRPTTLRVVTLSDPLPTHSDKLPAGKLPISNKGRVSPIVVRDGWVSVLVMLRIGGETFCSGLTSGECSDSVRSSG